MKEYSDCFLCHSKERRILLHNIRLRGEYHKLCTSCVLKHHSGSFCPLCFEIYEGLNPHVDCIECFNCKFPSHLACVGKDLTTDYLCPSCLYPPLVYFDVGGVGGVGGGGDGGNGGGGFNNKNSTSSTSTSSSNRKVIDIKLSKILLTAAQFASMSMKRAVTNEWTEAEKRIKEAWLKRKRAGEALQEVHSTALRLKGANGNGNGNESKMMMIQPIPSPVVVEEPMKKPKGNSAVAIALAAQKITDQKRIQALIEGNNARPVVQTPFTNGAPAVLAVPAVAVGNNNKLKGSPTTGMDYQQFRNAATVNGKEKPLNISQLRINDAKVESENNGLLLVPKTEGLLQRPQINHPIKEDPDEVKESGGSADAFNSRNNKGVLHTGSSKTMS